MSTFIVREVISAYSVKEIELPFVKTTDSRDAATLFRAIWDADMTVERMYALYLNRANEVQSYALVSLGGRTGAVVDNAVIIRKALMANACGIIVAHNHPSGNLTASVADYTTTENLKKACDLFSITLMDSLILTCDKYVSILHGN